MSKDNEDDFADDVEEDLDPAWDEDYVVLLDAIGEYMEKIANRGDTSINERDITIIYALIDFYDYEVQSWEEVMDVINDVAIRCEQLELEEVENNVKH
jgi:hypothetical protein